MISENENSNGNDDNHNGHNDDIDNDKDTNASSTCFSSLRMWLGTNFAGPTNQQIIVKIQENCCSFQLPFNRELPDKRGKTEEENLHRMQKYDPKQEAPGQLAR